LHVAINAANIPSLFRLLKRNEETFTTDGVIEQGGAIAHAFEGVFIWLNGDWSWPEKTGY
jgi:hypothetical protein